MAISLTYFVHSTTPDNEKGISSGWNDVPLSDLGMQQSYELRDTLKDADFDIIFCSDLLRARQTTEIVFPNHENIIYDTRLRECNYGDLNGSPSDIVEPLQERNILTPFPGGESCEDVKVRVENLLNEIGERYPDKRIAFVSSKIPQIVIEMMTFGYTWGEAFDRDWRNTKTWKPGWKYSILNK